MPTSVNFHSYNIIMDVVLVINNMLHMVLCWNSILGKDPTAWCRCKRCWFRCYRNISRLSDEEIVSDHTTNSQQHQLMGNKIPLVFHMNTHVLSLSLSLSLSLFLSLSPPLPLSPVALVSIFLTELPTGTPRPNGSAIKKHWRSSSS